jgi:uncharacterized protein (TIGR03437 family)
LLQVGPDQIRAILPSSLPVGQIQLGLLVNGVDALQDRPILVTGGRFAPFSQNGVGFGPAVIQQQDASGTLVLNRLTEPAAPGSLMTLWGTGLGPLPAGVFDAEPSEPGTVRNEVTVYIGGIPVTPLYAGRAPGLFGVDQIDFILPENVPQRCFVPIQVTTSSAASGVTSLAAGPANESCSSEFGLTASQLASLDASGFIRVAVLSISSSTSSEVVTQSAETWRGYMTPLT